MKSYQETNMCLEHAQAMINNIYIYVHIYIISVCMLETITVPTFRVPVESLSRPHLIPYVYTLTL